MQMLLAQHPNEIAFIRGALGLSEEEARLVGRLKTVKGSHAQLLWINGSRGRGRVSLQGRADRVLVLHLRPGRRRAAARRKARRARRRRVGPRSASLPATAARPPASPHRRAERQGHDGDGEPLPQPPGRRGPPSTRPATGHVAPAPRTTIAPLLAVCGVCGGAGTSTLSYLVARFAAAAARGHVLVCDTGGPAGGLAACARVQSPRVARRGGPPSSREGCRCPAGSTRSTTRPDRPDASCA